MSLVCTEQKSVKTENNPIEKLRDFFLNLEKKLTAELKEDDILGYFEKIKEKFKTKNYLDEEAKIFLSIALIAISIFWIGKSFFVLAYSEEFNMKNAYAKEAVDEEISNNEKIDPKKMNLYSFKSSEEQCAEDGEQKKTSSLCGKDNEEEIKRQLAEERTRKLARSRISVRRAVVVGKMPVAFVVVGGRRVCSKKNDHPSKSNQNKKGHMDMECCLDPDEKPNPNCYYGERYAKYL